MVDQVGELRFLQGIHVRIDISISVRSMTTKFGKQVFLQEFTQIKLIKQVTNSFITSRSRDKLKPQYLPYQNVYEHQTLWDGNLPWWADSSYNVT